MLQPGPAPLRVHVFSSDPRVERAVADALSAYMPVSSGDPLERTEEEGVLFVGVLDIRERESQLRWQEHFRGQGAPFLRIEVEPDSLCVGPTVVSGTAGCVECLGNWSRTAWTDLNLKQGAPPEGQRAGPDMPSALLAALVADYLAAGQETGRIAVFNRASGETIVRRFQPHPFCRLCHVAGQDSAERARLDLKTPIAVLPGRFRAVGAPDLDALERRFRDQRTGLVRYLFDEPSSSVMPMAVASFLHDGSLETFENGYGRTATRRGSRAVALLETLERYAGFMPRDRRSVVRGSYDEVRVDAIDPADFILHDPAQMTEPGYNLVAYSSDLPVNWVWGYSMRRHRPVLVPEQLVYYRLPQPPSMPTNRFVYEVSNGCALGGSVVEAALHGLFETIERDAFLSCWYTRRASVQLDVSDAENPDIVALVARAEAAGYEVHLFDVSSNFGVTAVWGLIVNPAADAPVKSYSAAGASIDPEAAVFSALVEICTSLPVYEGKLPQQRDKAQKLLDDSAEVQTMEDHVLLYSHPDSLDRMAFLFGRPGKVPLKARFPDWYRDRSGSELVGVFEGVCARVLSEARDVIVVDQSFGPLVDAGLRCVKILAPGLSPVTFGHQHRRISMERLRRYAGADAPVDLGGVNPYPHNFP